EQTFFRGRVGQPVLTVEGLLARGENKLRAAVHALDGFVVGVHEAALGPFENTLPGEPDYRKPQPQCQRNVKGPATLGVRPRTASVRPRDPGARPQWGAPGYRAPGGFRTS